MNLNLIYKVVFNLYLTEILFRSNVKKKVSTIKYKEMEKIDVTFKELISGNCVIKVHAVRLITEDLESLEIELNTLGAKILTLPCYEKGNTLKFELYQSVDISREVSVAIPGVDGLPLYVILSKIANIYLSNVHDNYNVTSIVLVGGATVNVDEKFFIVFKKYWIKKENLACIIDLSNSKESVVKELSLVEGFSAVYDEYSKINERKLQAVKDQNFVTAAEEREKEIPLLEKLDTYVGNFLISIWEQYFHQGV